MKSNKRSGTFLLVAGIATLIDQGVNVAMVELLGGAGPIALTGFLNLRLGFNTGVSFSLFADTFGNTPWLLALITIGIVIVVAVLGIRADRRVDVISYALIVGGAAGNILDRFRLGAVVDYIDLYYKDWHWPTFNLADCLIFLGVALLIASSTILPQSRKTAS